MGHQSIDWAMLVPRAIISAYSSGVRDAKKKLIGSIATLPRHTS